jgi:hypothetical protein
MITHCPKCNNMLNFSDAQLVKIRGALASVGSGTLKLKCPHCKDQMELLADGSSADWRQKPVGAQQGSKMPDPPKPPDIDWLTQGVFEEKETIKDIPKILILINKGETREKVVGAMVESFFQPIFVDTVAEALEQMQVVQFDAVILHSNFNNKPFLTSEFHDFMKKMPMTRRRYIFYALLGPEFNTLYTLEAASYSANMVINERDVAFVKNIYKRGKSEYEELFGSYISALKEHGRN